MVFMVKIIEGERRQTAFYFTMQKKRGIKQKAHRKKKFPQTMHIVCL